MKKLISLFVLLSLFIGCDSCLQPPPSRPTPIVTDTDYCQAAEDNLIKLGCQEGRPTKTGKKFAAFCLETQQNGVFLNPKCLSTIKYCGEIDSCTGSK